jgi:hypothetical protein
MLVGNAQVARRPPAAKLPLHWAEHVDHDVIKGHALREQLGGQPVGERDVAVDEGGQHRKALVARRGSVGIRTHRTRLPSPCGRA